MIDILVLSLLAIPTDNFQSCYICLANPPYACFANKSNVINHNNY